LFKSTQNSKQNSLNKVFGEPECVAQQRVDLDFKIHFSFGTEFLTLFLKRLVDWTCKHRKF